LPFAGLSLELPSTSPAPEGPFPFDPATDNPALSVRLELAQALWEAGQPHTARALAEDVAEQAQGPLQQQARAWIAARA
jgi:FimV-like protein